MVKTTHIKANHLILVATPLLLLFFAIIAGAQLIVNETHPPQPLASNNQILQQNIQDQTTVNCTIVTTKPISQMGKYIFNKCIVSQLSAYLTIGPNKYIELNNGNINATSSRCENITAGENPKLVIDYTCAQIEFDIDRTNDNKTFVKSISGHYIENNISIPFSNTTRIFNTTQPGHYYKCDSEQSILTSVNNTILVVSKFALEAYRDTTGTEFYQIAEECLLDSQPVSDLVRIGVGVCLVALVAIVLIAYFIGRRRWSERSSYESV